MHTMNHIHIQEFSSNFTIFYFSFYVKIVDTFSKFLFKEEDKFKFVLMFF